jgi:integrase
MANTTQHRRFGNVRRLPSGRYQARWSGPDGFSHKAGETFDTADAARAWLSSQESARATNQLIDERHAAMTVAALYAAWRREAVGKRASTLARETTVWANQIAPTFGTRAVGAITKGEVAVWIAAMRRGSDGRPDGLSVSTVRKAVVMLIAILDLAVRDRRILENPAKGHRLPRPERGELRILTKAELERLADAIDPRYSAMVITAGHTGLRIGELAALVAGDVDLLRKRLTVRHASTQVFGKLHYGPPKTKAGLRTVPLSAAALEALTPLVGSVSHRDDLIFPAPSGGYLRPSTWLDRFWRPALRAAGLEGLRVHDLRHTAISLWVAAGMDPKAIAAWAGHTSIVTVLDRYAHRQPDADTAALARFDAWLAAQS